MDQIFHAPGRSIRRIPENDTIEVTIVPNETKTLNLELLPLSMETVTVFASINTNEGGEIKSAKETQESEKVITTVTSKQLKGKGVSNVADGAKKMTGMSTVGDILYVRGLGDRYNVAYLIDFP